MGESKRYPTDRQRDLAMCQRVNHFISYAPPIERHQQNISIHSTNCLPSFRHARLTFNHDLNPYPKDSMVLSLVSLATRDWLRDFYRQPVACIFNRHALVSHLAILQSSRSTMHKLRTYCSHGQHGTKALFEMRYRIQHDQDSRITFR